MKEESAKFNRKREREEERGGQVMNRFEENREFDGREAAKRAILNMKYADPLYFPPELVPHGVEYKWVRHSLFGAPDNNNIFNAEKKGWKPVPANRHPEFIPADYLGVRTHKDSYFTVGDSILCERDKELCDLEREVNDDYNHQVLMSMPGLNNLMGEPSMPVRNATETYVSRAASFAKGKV